MAIITTRSRTNGVPSPQPTRSDGYALESAKHLLDLLIFLGSSGGDHSISGLGRSLGITFSRAYRLVATLEAKGFVERDPATKRYRIGPRAFEVGMRFAAKAGRAATTSDGPKSKAVPPRVGSAR